MRCYVQAMDDEGVELECFFLRIRMERQSFGELGGAFCAEDVVYVMAVRGNQLCFTPEAAKAGRSDSDALDRLDNYLSEVKFITQRKAKSGLENSLLASAC